MKSKITGSIFGLALVVVTSDVAGAAIIAGPSLTSNDSGYLVSGLGFQALDNSTLTAFTFQNQGSADTVSLTNSVGTILDSATIPASTPSDVVSGLTWSLTSGNSYYLLQTGGVNGRFGTFGFTLPSDTDIAITTTFNGGATIVAALSGTDVGGFWGDFNNITTASVSAVPAPGSLSLVAPGLGALGLLGWRRKRKAAALAA
jgi:hypothetical protein